MFDDTAALEWILNQADDDSIEELTSPMIEKLIRDAKNVVVLFCKYAGYMLIAITHTCYMLRHYSSSTTSMVRTKHEPLRDPVTGEIIQNGGTLITAEQMPDTYLPADRVKGFAMES